MRKLSFQVLSALVLLAPLAACNEGPAERAGRSIDNAGTAIRDAVDPPRGPAERLGRDIDRATR
jgi:predicted small secreted protein